jgi:hypothetical protein
MSVLIFTIDRFGRHGIYINMSMLIFMYES